MLITPDFAFETANPFTFGFDETNPFGFDVENLTVTTSTQSLAASLTFDEIQIQVSNSNPGGEGVNRFAVQLGVNVPAVVPDSSSTVGLLGLGLLATAGFAKRRAFGAA